MICPYCYEKAIEVVIHDLILEIYDCDNHPVRTRIYLSEKDKFAHAFLVNYKDKVYALTIGTLVPFIIEEWEALDGFHEYYFKDTILTTTYISANLTPETALSKLKSFLPFI